MTCYFNYFFKAINKREIFLFCYLKMFCLICESYINRFISNQVCLKCSLKGTEFIRKLNISIWYFKHETSYYNIYLILGFFKSLLDLTKKMRTFGDNDDYNLKLVLIIDQFLIKSQHCSQYTEFFLAFVTCDFVLC